MNRPPSPPRRYIRHRSAVNAMLYIGVMAMAAITWFDYQARQGDTAGVKAMPVDAVRTIGIHLLSHNSIKLSKHQQTWWLESPVQRPAIDSRVNTILSILDHDTDTMYDAAELNVGELGLALPKATIHFSSGRDQFTVLIGDKGPHEQRRYLQIGQRIALLDDVYLPLIEAGADIFAKPR